MKNIDKEQIEKEKNMAHQNMFYSVQRIDLLIIAVSGAGVYVCLETLKFIVEEKLDESPLLIKLAGLMFVLAVVVNFISQITSKKTNYYDYLMSCAILEDDEKKAERYDCISGNWDMATTLFNTSSIVIMSIGLILILVFFFGFV